MSNTQDAVERAMELFCTHAELCSYQGYDAKLAAVRKREFHAHLESMRSQNDAVHPSAHAGASGEIGGDAVVAPRYVVTKESGSEWARVIDTTTGRQVTKYSVMPKKNSLRDGWAMAEHYVQLLNENRDLSALAQEGKT